MTTTLEGKTPLANLTLDDLNNIFEKQLSPLSTKLTGLQTSIDTLQKDYEDLKKEVIQLRKEKLEDHRRLNALEDQLKKKNIIFKGLDEQSSADDAVRKVCTEKLEIAAPEIKSTKKIYSRNGKMGVVAEFNSEDAVWKVLHNSRKLAHSSIMMERDLNTDRQQDKRVLLQLKKDILAENKDKRVAVRDDRLRVGSDLWVKWNDEKKLVCGKEEADAESTIKNLYGSQLNSVNFNYNVILGKIKRQ